MRDPQRWKPGEVIVFRGVGKKGIWYALPAYVVQDRFDLLAVYWPAGAPGKFRLPAPDAHITPQEVVTTPMALIDRTWQKTDVLMLVPPSAAHAVYLMRAAGWKEVVCWYINLQNPMRRTPIGFDTRDHVLDVVFSPDRSSWQWKDEDQLAEAVTVGMFTRAEAGAIRAEGERVIRAVGENQPPFCEGWEQWSPPSGWAVPRLPEDWDLGFRE